MDHPDGPSRRQKSEEVRTPKENRAKSRSEIRRKLLITPVPDAARAIEIPQDPPVVDMTQPISGMNSLASTVDDVSYITASTSTSTPSSFGCSRIRNSVDSILSSSATGQESDENSMIPRWVPTGCSRLPSFSISVIQPTYPGSRRFVSPEPSPASDEAPSAPERRKSRPSHRNRARAAGRIPLGVLQVIPNSGSDDGRSVTNGNISVPRSANAYDASQSSMNSSYTTQEGESVPSPLPPRSKRPRTVNETAPGTSSSSGSNANKTMEPRPQKPVSKDASAPLECDDSNDQEGKKKRDLSPPNIFVIPRADFQWEVRRAFTSLGLRNFTIQGGALDALQVAVESFFLLDFFEELSLAALHAERKTIMQRDVTLQQELAKKRGNFM